MTTFTLILAASSLPACFAITASRRAGFRGFIGLAVWLAEAVSREAWILAGALRKFDQGRVEARRQWMEEAR